MLHSRPNIPVEWTAHSAGFVAVPGFGVCGLPLTGGVSLFKNSQAPLTCYNSIRLTLVREGVRAMSDRGAQILKDALSLPPTERVALVERLLASLDSPAREHIDVLWGQEAEDRLEAFERGEIPTIAAKDVFDEIRKR
jgi:putative addiction module component (TIGR02574 family)